MLVMTLLARDEADIIRQNIAFHLACGVDHVIATDNGSTDGTLEILREFADRGVLTLLQEPGRDFAQHAWVTRMALMARERFGARWILNCDADEFWLAPELGLAAALARHEGATALRCEVRNIIGAHDDPEVAPWWQRLESRIAEPIRVDAAIDPLIDPLPAPFYYLEFGSKVIVRAEGLTRIAQGNHMAERDGPELEETGAVVVYHYSLRTRRQFVRSVERTAAGYARNTTLGRYAGWQKKRWGRMIAEDGNAARALADALPDRDRLDRDLAAGIVLRDVRAQQALQELDIV